MQKEIGKSVKELLASILPEMYQKTCEEAMNSVIHCGSLQYSFNVIFKGEIYKTVPTFMSNPIKYRKEWIH
jgi:hypothetical protein